MDEAYRLWVAFAYVMGSCAGDSMDDEDKVQQIKIDGWNDLIDRIERLERPDTPEQPTPDDIPTGADPHDD